MEEIDYQLPRGLESAVGPIVDADSDWVRRQQHVLITGKTGTGKTFWRELLGRKPVGTV